MAEHKTASDVHAERLAVGDALSAFADAGMIAPLSAETPPGPPVAWRWRTLPMWREDEDDGDWSFLAKEPEAADYMNFHHFEFEPLFYRVAPGDEGIEVDRHVVETAARIVAGLLPYPAKAGLPDEAAFRLVARARQAAPPQDGEAPERSPPANP